MQNLEQLRNLARTGFPNVVKVFPSCFSVQVVPHFCVIHMSSIWLLNIDVRLLIFRFSMYNALAHAASDDLSRRTVGQDAQTASACDAADRMNRYSTAHVNAKP